MISGKTTLIAHLGYPTEAFKAPMIYNPWFDSRASMRSWCRWASRPRTTSCDPEADLQVHQHPRRAGDHAAQGDTVALMTRSRPPRKVAGACNAILLRPDGTLLGDQFDGAGFVRGVQRKGVKLEGARVLVSGNGGVGCAIAASLAAAGAGEMALYDAFDASSQALAGRLREHYPRLKVKTGSNDPAGYDVIVNATPLGMKDGDPLPFDVSRIAPSTFVGEVVMKQAITPLLAAARAKGCAIQVGTDMLFEQIPAYLEFFGFGTATPDELRAVSQVRY
jgi:shikimate dehydrogenase